MRLLLVLPLMFLAGLPLRAAEPCPCAPDLTGKWTSGAWESFADGHKGPLTATFEKLSPAQYRVKFRGRFFRVIPFHYTVMLDVVGQCGDRALLAGSSNLPLFGTYTYTAEASGSAFVANYQAKVDHGQFRLRR